MNPIAPFILLTRLSAGEYLAVIGFFFMFALVSQIGGSNPKRTSWAPLGCLLLTLIGVACISLRIDGQESPAMPALRLLQRLNLRPALRLLQGLGAILILFSWPIARLLLIPLGLHRAAYYLSLTSLVTFNVDLRGGAALAAAWAIARRPALDEEAVAWVDAKLARTAPLRGGGFLAAGLLLAARGDMAGARSLVETALDLDPRACPPAVRRLASGFLAADAAERGDWDRVAELGLILRDDGRTLVAVAPPA